MMNENFARFLICCNKKLFLKHNPTLQNSEWMVQFMRLFRDGTNKPCDIDVINETRPTLVKFAGKMAVLDIQKCRYMFTQANGIGRGQKRKNKCCVLFVWLENGCWMFLRTGASVMRSVDRKRTNLLNAERTFFIWAYHKLSNVPNVLDLFKFYEFQRSNSLGQIYQDKIWFSWWQTLKSEGAIPFTVETSAWGQPINIVRPQSFLKNQVTMCSSQIQLYKCQMNAFLVPIVEIALKHNCAIYCTVQIVIYAYNDVFSCLMMETKQVVAWLQQMYDRRLKMHANEF